jgi:hypothetical protein
MLHVFYLDVAKVDVIPPASTSTGTYHRSEVRARGSMRAMGVGGPVMDAQVRSTERSETRNSRHGLACIRVAPCGGGRASTQLHPHVGQAR